MGRGLWVSGQPRMDNEVLPQGKQSRERKEKGEIHTELYYFFLYIEFLQYISLHLHILSTT